MHDRITYDVIPANDEEWELLRRGERRGRTYTSKRAAIRAAVAIATSYPEGELIIRDGDGEIEKQRTYHGRARMRG